MKTTMLSRVRWVAVARLAALVVLSLLCGCKELQPNASVGISLVAKSRGLVDLSAAIFALEPRFWGDAFKNLYYAALTLARAKRLYDFYESSENFHSKVWQVASADLRKYFYRNLYKKRTRFDYSLSLPSSGEILKDAEELSREAPQHFAKLIQQTETHLEKAYWLCTEAPETCTHCRPATQCGKGAAIAALKDLQSATDHTLRIYLAGRISEERRRVDTTPDDWPQPKWD